MMALVDALDMLRPLTYLDVPSEAQLEAFRIVEEALHIDAEWLTPTLPDLVNQSEAVEILGITKATIIRWRAAGSGPHGPEGTYMIPPAMAGPTPVWVRADVERFRDKIGRQRAPVAAASG